MSTPQTFDDEELATPIQSAPADFKLFSYEVGEEPDDNDEEVNNTDGEEEGEEEQDEALIVEGYDDDFENETEPSPTYKRSPNEVAAEESSPTIKTAAQKKGAPKSPAKKSITKNKEAKIQTQLYGGDIYLLGGSHFIMKDQDATDDQKAQQSSLASTNTGSDMPSKTKQANRVVSPSKK